MKIGILETGHVPEPLVENHGDYPAMFERMLARGGFAFQPFAVTEGEFPPDVHACDGWLITGSHHGAYEARDWIARLETFIRAAYDAGVPMAGICFGHQIMAQALGGRVEKFSGGWSLGRKVYRSGNDELALNAMHQDQVVEQPAESCVIMANDFCRFAGLVYGRKAISYQPHPEFTEPYIRDLIEFRRPGLPPGVADAAAASLQSTDDAGRVAQEICAFFRSARSEC